MNRKKLSVTTVVLGVALSILPGSASVAHEGRRTAKPMMAGARSAGMAMGGMSAAEMCRMMGMTPAGMAMGGMSAAEMCRMMGMTPAGMARMMRMSPAQMARMHAGMGRPAGAGGPQGGMGSLGGSIR